MFDETVQYPSSQIESLSSNELLTLANSLQEVLHKDYPVFAAIPIRFNATASFLGTAQFDDKGLSRKYSRASVAKKLLHKLQKTSNVEVVGALFTVETAAFDVDRLQHFIQTAQLILEDLADQLRVDKQYLMQYPVVVAAFVLLHEYGHIYDVLNNYSNKELNEQAVIAADGRFREDQQLGLSSLPIPGYAPSMLVELNEVGDLEALLEDNAERLATLGIHNPEKLIEAQSAAYIALPQEKIATQFAVTLLEKHWDDLGLPARPK